MLHGWLTSHVCIGIWLGTPCSSWSRARHDIDGGGPRDKYNLLGKPNLSDADQLRVSNGNRTMRASVQLIKTCATVGAICVLENPHTSMLFQVPVVRALVNTGQIAVTDYCQFDTRWRKRTQFVFWNVSDVEPLCKRCHGRNSICSKSLLPHIILKGHDRASGMSWTKLAEPYPPKLVKVAVNIIVDALENRRLHRLSSLAGC